MPFFGQFPCDNLSSNHQILADNDAHVMAISTMMTMRMHLQHAIWNVDWSESRGRMCSTNVAILHNDQSCIIRATVNDKAQVSICIASPSSLSCPQTNFGDV